MVAWWLRGVTFFNVLLLGAWCVWSWPRSPWLMLVGVVLGVLAGRIWLGLQFLVMLAAQRRSGLMVPAPAQVLRAWSAESSESGRLFGWLMPWCEHAIPDAIDEKATGQQGVVLVHGWLCNRAVWTAAIQQLRADGIPYVAVSLPLLLHRIEAARPAVDSAVRRMQAATGQAPVIAAHSMGGLVVRDWLRSLDANDEQARVARDVVTIGTPHRGTLLANCVWGANVEQMRPANAWLAALERDEARENSAFSFARWHCFYSDVDNVVFPSTTAVLPGARSSALTGDAHVQMLRSPMLWTYVRQLLVSAPSPNRTH